MLSPKPYTPSTSLLRFLRSQSGFSAILSSCAGPAKSPFPCPDRVSPPNCSSRPSSTWACFDAQKCSSPLGTGSLNILSSRPKPSGAASSLSWTHNQLILSRHASSKSRPLLRRLFELKRSKSQEYKSSGHLGPALIDDTTEGIFNVGRGLAAKASNELRIRCTEFDTNGNVTLVNGEFRKSELIAKVGTEPYDLNS